MEQQLKLVVGCDLAAYDFKCAILKEMRTRGYAIDDLGCESSKEGLYSVYAKKVADKIADKTYDYGLLFCGTGQGMAMAANKVSGCRAVLCYDIFPAVMSKEHNNGNILCTGAWTISVEHALRMIEAWLFAKYAGNHDEGLGLIEQYEQRSAK